MYPNLRYAFYDFFGVDIPALALIQSYGFFLAMAFLVSAIWLNKELRRREKVGLLQPVKEEVKVGQPFTVADGIVNALIGFLLGYKGVYALFNPSIFNGNSTKGALLSPYVGYWWAGIILAVLFVYLKYRERQKAKEEYPEPQTIERDIYPHQRVGDIIIIAAVSGIIGAKILYLFGAPDEFHADPIGALFSGSGLTVYGGLILATFVVIYYAKQKKIPIRQLMDICAPAMILAYGVGRLGCHFSGDGDWGDPNPFKQPSWLPDWMFAYNYPNNVLNEGIMMSECGYPPSFGDYCHQLENPVYPTPVWEFMMAFIIFLILVALRKRIKVHGLLFAIYLVFNGLERFMIEVIRVNAEYELLGVKLTEAQLIAIVLFFIGLIFTILLCRQQIQLQKQAIDSN
ncbi:MAG: prolipoprotein diacylglyceryl transferase [Saprospiraceae bacterium]|nr:prolipoprotein diacylglyceryl transferase [Saprospiraceae bacterium]